MITVLFFIHCTSVELPQTDFLISTDKYKPLYAHWMEKSHDFFPYSNKNLIDVCSQNNCETRKINNPKNWTRLTGIDIETNTKGIEKCIGKINI